MVLLFRKVFAVSGAMPMLLVSNPRFIWRSSPGLLSRKEFCNVAVQLSPWIVAPAAPPIAPIPNPTASFPRKAGHATLFSSF